jgi:DNA-binding response OmpR family regulator
MEVLVVGDSGRLRRTLAEGLRAMGMTADTAADGAQVLQKMRA